MPIIDEIRQQRKTLKSKPFKEKLDYFWYYYKTHVIVTFFAFIIGTILIHDLITAKDTAFYAAFLNSFATQQQDEEFMAEFAPLTDVDLTKHNIYLDTNIRFNVESYDEDSMAAAQKFMALSATGDINVVVSERNVFANYANNGVFMDLRDCLTDGQLGKYKDHFFYFDETILDQEIDYERITGDSSAIPDDTLDRRNPETMEKPVPVGIFLDDSMKNKLTEMGYYGKQQEIIFGIMNTEDTSVYCQQFLDWLTCEE